MEYDGTINQYSEPVNCYDIVANYEYFKYNADLENHRKGPSHLIGMIICGTIGGYKYILDDNIIIHIVLPKLVPTLI